MYDLSFAMNGGLSGLVIGLIAGLVYIGFSKMLVKLHIDDAVDAIPVHFGNGIWGCIATGLFADPGKVETAYGSPAVGLFFGAGSSHQTNLIVAELCGIAFIIVWVTVVMTPYFIILRCLGLFRVDELEEEIGMDISHHKGAAYDLSKPDDGAVDEFIEKRSHHGTKPVAAKTHYDVTKTTVTGPNGGEITKTEISVGGGMVAQN